MSLTARLTVDTDASPIVIARPALPGNVDTSRVVSLSEVQE